MSTEMSDDCFSGTTWEGKPTGKVRKIGGVDVYVATPPSDVKSDKTKAVLYLPDVFGIQLVNNLLLADDFAKSGYYTYAVDLFAGDPLKDSDMNNKDFDRAAWGAKHPEPEVQALLESVIEGLKEEGIKEFAATGYCFGARFVFNLAFTHTISVGIVSHPSRLKVPEDLYMLKEAGVPMLFNTCRFDSAYPEDSQHAGDAILGGGSKVPTNFPYRRVWYEGCTHGFAVRGDQSNPQVKFGKEDSFKQSIVWLKHNNF